MYRLLSFLFSIFFSGGLLFSWQVMERFPYFYLKSKFLPFI